MVSPRAQSSGSSNADQRDDARVPANEALVQTAERELLDALVKQSSPVFGMYFHPSPEDRAAFTRAVDAICREAHRLDLRAEELVIAIKKAWSHLAAIRTTRLADRDSDVLHEVVSTSIEVFFQSRNGAGRSAAP